MSDLYSIVEQWTGGYCAGAIMPKTFRIEASFWFDKTFELCKRESLTSIIDTNNIIYRIQTLETKEKCVIKYDDLYYSFSNDINGLKQVIRKDSYIKSNLIIIEYKPLKPINLNNLLDDMYVGYKSIYTSENEILSKLSKSNVKNIYYLKDSKDICNYKTKGMKIDIKDSCLSYEKFIKKYKIGMCV